MWQNRCKPVQFVLLWRICNRSTYVGHEPVNFKHVSWRFQKLHVADCICCTVPCILFWIKRTFWEYCMFRINIIIKAAAEKQLLTSVLSTASKLYWVPASFCTVNIALRTTINRIAYSYSLDRKSSFYLLSVGVFVHQNVLQMGKETTVYDVSPFWWFELKWPLYAKRSCAQLVSINSS